MSTRVGIIIVTSCLALLYLLMSAIQPQPVRQPNGAQMADTRKAIIKQRELDKDKKVAEYHKHWKIEQEQHPYHDTMTDDWFRKRKDGEAGLSEVDRTKPGK